MQRVPVEKISIDAKLGLLVTPEHGNYEQIYRAANGLRWNQEHGAICAYEPLRWQASELLTHIAATIAAECGEELHFTASTSWLGIPKEVQNTLRTLLPLVG